MIYRENVQALIEKIDMIYQENWYDLTRKCMIYRENVWFTEKIDMIYWENVWLTEKMYDLPRKR